MNNFKLNWKKGPKDERDFKSTRHLTSPKILPQEFELDRQIPIYNQFSIGSCTANSACSCFRYEVAQLQNNFDFEPSRLFQYYNSRLLQGWENEDSGAYIRDAFKSMNKYGLALEKTWPYVVEDFARKPSNEAYQEGLKNVTVKYATVPQTEQHLKETLVSGAAISFGFNVYQSFYGSWHNTTGMMPIPKKSERLLGGHAVTLIGFSDAKKAFLVQNSWGEDWGLKGKYWMPYSFVINSVECDDFWCIEEVKIDDQTMPPSPGTLDWNIVSKVLFKTDKELYAVKKPTLLRLGEALGLPVDNKKNFTYNFQLIKQKLGL